MRRLIILFCILLIVFLSFFVAGYYIVFDYDFTDSYTSAVCSENMCQDYEFTCLNGEIVLSRAISGLVVFDDDWVDLRSEKENKY